MNLADKETVRASRLRTVLNMPEFQETYVFWLEQMREKVLHDLTLATELHEFHRAQGAYQVLRSLEEEKEAILRAETLKKKVKGD